MREGYERMIRQKLGQAIAERLNPPVTVRMPTNEASAWPI
jgi:hypothetical protein